MEQTISKRWKPGGCLTSEYSHTQGINKGTQHVWLPLRCGLQCNIYKHATRMGTEQSLAHSSTDNNISETFPCKPPPPPPPMLLTLTNRTIGSLRAPPTKLCTTPLEPLTRPLLALRVRVSITWAPTFNSTVPLACNKHFLDRLTNQDISLDERRSACAVCLRCKSRLDLSMIFVGHD